MERPHRAHEHLALQMSILAEAMAAASVPTNQSRTSARARLEMWASFPGPFFFGESCPFALFRLTNQRRPSFGLRIESELIRELAVFRKKSKFNAEQFVIKFSIAECGIGCAKNIDPVANITLRVIVEAMKTNASYSSFASAAP